MNEKIKAFRDAVSKVVSNYDGYGLDFVSETLFTVTGRKCMDGFFLSENLITNISRLEGVSFVGVVSYKGELKAHFTNE